MSRRALWLCLSLLVCACGVEDAPEPAEDLGEDSNSADQATDQEMRDLQTQDQGDDVPAPVDMSDDIRPDDIPSDIPVEADVPVDMSADTTTQDLSADVDAQDDANADIVLDADVDVEQDPDVEQGDVEIDIPNDISLDQVETDTVEDALTDIEEDIEEETVDGDIVDEDMSEDVDAEHEFPIEYDYPTDRFVSIGPGPCAIREQDNLRYCWGARSTRIQDRYTPYRQLSHFCALTLSGEVQCFLNPDFILEGTFIHVSMLDSWIHGYVVCTVDENHQVVCYKLSTNNESTTYLGSYKKATPLDYFGMCGINMNDEIQCESLYLDLYEDLYGEWYERWYNNLIVNAPRVRAIDISHFEQGCVCALLENHTIRCWGHELCGDISYGPYQQNRYNFISNPLSTCAVKIDGQIQCVNFQSAQERAEQLNQHAPFSQVLYDARCALKTNGEVVCTDELPPVSETTGRKIVVERGDYCSLDEEGYATCRSLVNGKVWTSTPDVRFSLIKLEYEGAAYGLDIEGRFYHWAREPRYLIQSVINLDIPENFRAKDVFPGARGNVCFHKLDDTVQCFLYNGWEPTAINEQMPEPDETFLSVDIRGDIACGVKYDNSIDCWGRTLGRTGEQLISDVNIPMFTVSEIELFYDFVCIRNMAGNTFCAAYTEEWMPVFENENISKVIYAGEGSWCAITLSGRLVCDQTDGIVESQDDFLVSAFQTYVLIDVSSTGNGGQVCGIREDTHTVVCRGITNWGW